MKLRRLRQIWAAAMRTLELLGCTSTERSGRCDTVISCISVRMLRLAMRASCTYVSSDRILAVRRAGCKRRA